MPIRFSKNFVRRKSAGNVLDDVEPPRESSFRVLDQQEREQLAQARQQLQQEQQKAQQARRTSTNLLVSWSKDKTVSKIEEVGNNTNNSTSTTGASSSDRYSYGSTQPSSVESFSHTDKEHRPQPYVSAERNQTLDATADDDNIFSNISTLRPSTSAHQPSTRERASTISSYASTAEPPKLDLAGDGEFGSGLAFILDGLGKNRTSTIMEEPPLPPPPVARSESDGVIQSRSNPYRDAAPISRNLDKSPAPGYARPSWESNRSEEMFTTSRSRLAMNAAPVRSGLSRESPSPTRDDENTELFASAAYASRALEKKHDLPSGPRNNSILERSRGGAETWTQPQQKTVHPQSTFAEDESLFDTPRSFDHSSTVDPSIPRMPARTMTRDQFEHLKQREADAKDDDDDHSQVSEESASYEDEDESERTKQMAKTRRKQEANLAVYRQQMMKMTGEQVSELPTRPTRPSDLNRSTLSMPNFSSFNLNNATTATEGKVSDDSDEDVPLGVLQAHGFPHKSRPPTRLGSNTTDSTILRPSNQQQNYANPNGASRNEAGPGAAGSSLPPFARHLPADPYIGAGLVNHTNRESLGQNLPRQASPGSPLPPGGLVGVIAGEERAKAMRRGSPNTAGNYGTPIPQLSPTMPQMPQLQVPHMNMPYQQSSHAQSMPFLQPPETPYSAEQAQLQMSQQMQQMMQMQMHWMQQMMQMQNGGQNMPGMPAMPLMPAMQDTQQKGFLAPTSFNPRPDSMMSSVSSNIGGFGRPSTSMSRPVQPRAGYASSMYGETSAHSVHNLPKGEHGRSYAASIAPSERSNVGQPSRYRPVTPSNIDMGKQSRSSTMTLKLTQGFGNLGPSNNYSDYTGKLNKSKSIEGLRSPGGLPATVKVVDKPKRSGSSDDEDEEGWETIRRKREERKNKWRSRTASTARQPSPPKPGLEALFFDGSNLGSE